jgi:hypothetical protein
MARYRIQLAAYGVALSRILDEPIGGGVLVHCRADGPAEQLVIPDWADALAAVTASAVAQGGEPIGEPTNRYGRLVSAAQQPKRNR